METSKTLELGTKPVGKLLWEYAIPAIIAMIASSMYNMVDRIFIGQGVGPLAISGRAITFPFMNLSGAFGAAIGIGSSTLISVSLGRKEYDKARNLFGNNITLNIILGIAFGVICLIFLDPILLLFGATEQTLPYAREYMQVILAGNLISHMYFGMNAVLRAASKPKHAMGATIFTVVLNSILDPIFIYGFHWGIQGAAYATILSQFLALAWLMWLFSNKKEILHHCKGIYSLNWGLVKDIFTIGLSPFCMNACACLVVIFINNALVRYGGDYAVGAYGIGNSVVFIFVMINIGINQGLHPIAGYNFGAKLYKRMLRVVTIASWSATAVCVVGWLVCEFGARYCVMLFTNDPELTRFAIDGIRINALLLPIIGYQMVITNFFQSIGKAKLSIFLSLSRQMLFLIPAIIILPYFFPGHPVDGVWAALPLSDALAALVAAWFMLVYMKRFKQGGIDDSEAPKVDIEHRHHDYYRSSHGARRGAAPKDSGSVIE